MKPSRTSALISAAIVFAAFEVTASGQTFTLLGPNVFPTDVSDDGLVVVGDRPVTNQYFEWSPGGVVTDIGGSSFVSAVGGQARISGNGARVAGTAFNAASGFHEISYFTRSTGQWTHLGGLGGTSGPEASSGWGMSPDGTNIVGLGWVPGTTSGRGRAISWTQAAGVTDLGSTFADRSSRANAVNADGSVVVGWQDAPSRRAAVWINGVQTLPATASGLGVGEASAVSDSGEWVTGIGTNSTGRQAWRWNSVTGGPVEALGTLFPGASPPTNGLATFISADGSIILGTDRPMGPAFGGEGFIWTEETGIVNFDTFLAGHGIDLDDTFDFAVPFAMSADGLTFVGIGRAPGIADGIGFVVTIPAPSATFPLALLASLCATRRRR